MLLFILKKLAYYNLQSERVKSYQLISHSIALDRAIYMKQRKYFSMNLSRNIF